MRSLGISALSLALTTMVVMNAYYQKKQFYPSVVYITKSNPSMAVIYIQAFIFVLLTGKLMKKVFFGELRTSEFEHLMERSWYAITETCLAFTVFRDDFNPKFVALFTLLLFLKSFHWLAEDRVDFMERSPVISYLFHVRVLSLLFVLGLMDVYFVEHAYDSTVSKGASVQLVFGFEYAILITMVLNIAIKYTLYSVDLNSETPWDNKAVFLLYTELIMGLIKVVLYVTFMFIMVRIYTLPLFALRPMYYTIRNFKKAFNDVILSRRAIHNMNTLYPDATLEELQAGDNVCIICREEMTLAAKKLPCNHIFHASCLRSWFQRQQTCPTCRLNILRTPAAQPEVRPEPRPRAPQPPPPQNLPPPPNPFNFNPFVMLNNNVRANQNAAAGEAAPQGNAAPPFFPFPPMPFMAPPPMPPPNLANLSPEELRRMEGNERANVEARIQWLRNIQLMLDSAVLMFQQYNTAAAMSMSMPRGPASTNQEEAAPTASSSNASTFEAPPTTASDSPTNNVTAPPTSDQGSAPPTPPKTVASAEQGVTNEAEPSSASCSNVETEITSTTENAAAGTPEAEVRRRRLQKFLQGERQ